MDTYKNNTEEEVPAEKLEEFKKLWKAFMEDPDIKAAFTAKIQREIGNILSQEGLIQR